MTAWDVSTAVYSTNSKVLAGSVSTGIFFSSDGVKMYSLDNPADVVYQYVLSTAWVVSTSANSNASYAVTSEETNPAGISFKPDGTKMYIVGGTNNTVFQYPLSSAWDLTTVGDDEKSKDVSASGTDMVGVQFKDDGTKMYVLAFSNDTVSQWTLSSAWDVSTATEDEVSKAVGGDESQSRDLYFKPDGTKMYITGSATDKVFQYPLSSAWDLSTAGATEANFYVGSQETTPQAVFFSPDGLNMYITGNTPNTAFEYNLPAVGTDIQINIGDAWKEISAMQINIGDAWKEVAGAQVNIGDAWKTIF